jgi:hypothetical protein
MKRQVTRGYKGAKLWAAAVCLLAVIACAGCGTAKDPATHAQLVDREATSAYLAAREVLIRSSMADLSAGRGPMAAFVAHVRAECSDALRGTPLDHIRALARSRSDGQERVRLIRDAGFSSGIGHVLEAAQQTRQMPAVRRFTRTVDSIRWHNPVVTDLVRTFIEVELLRRDLSQRVNVCTAIKEWSSTGYRRPPILVPVEPSEALANRWSGDVAALGCGKFSPVTPRELLRALRPYQQPGGQPTTRDVEVMEQRLFFEEERARNGAILSLGQALGVSAARRKPSKYRLPINALKPLPEPAGCSGKPGLPPG